MLYSLNFTISYSADMTQTDLFTIWKEEAEAALGAKSAGIVVDLWKVVGERRVLAVVDVESPDQLDQILFDLPIMKRMGQHVDVQVKSLRRYEDFAKDVSDRLK